jgi:outer membrane protein TolC
MQVDTFALLQAAREDAMAQVASIEARRNFWIAYTDLSVAVLGGGDLSPDLQTTITASAGADASGQ